MIKDYTFEVDTEYHGFCEHTTPPINGQIESLIVQVPQGTLDLGLYFNDMTGICMLEKYQLKGDNYIAIMSDTIADDATKYNFTQNKWILNNALYCLVEGNFNVKATITIRYSTI